MGQKSGSCQVHAAFHHLIMWGFEIVDVTSPFLIPEKSRFYLHRDYRLQQRTHSTCQTLARQKNSTYQILVLLLFLNYYLFWLWSQLMPPASPEEAIHKHLHQWVTSLQAGSEAPNDEINYHPQALEEKDAG